MIVAGLIKRVNPSSTPDGDASKPGNLRHERKACLGIGCGGKQVEVRAKNGIEAFAIRCDNSDPVFSDRMALSLIPLNPDLYAQGEFSIPGEAQVFCVGREGGNDIQVNDATVSARHAKIEVIDEEAVDVVDCGSSNGTFVNGIKVKRKRLADGDLLRFATVEYRVTADAGVHGNASAVLIGVTQAIDLTPIANHQAKQNSVELERDQLLGEVERLSTEVLELTEVLQGLQDCVSSRDEEIVRLSANWSASDAALRNTHAAAIADLAQIVQEREESLKALSADTGIQIQRLEGMFAERDAALKALSEGSNVEIQTLQNRLKGAEEKFNAFSRDREADIKALQDRLKEAEEKFNAFSRDREADIRGLKETIKERDCALQTLTSKSGTEIRLLSEKLASQEENTRQLKREIEDCLQREQRNLNQISETRKELMDREARIAALHYEVKTRDGSIHQISGQRLEQQKAYDIALADIAGLKSALKTEKGNVIAARESQNVAEARSADILSRLFKLANRLCVDWRGWFHEGESDLSCTDADATFSRVEDLAGRIRDELDLIEPVWQLFGDHVQEELAARCGAFREEEAELSAEILERRAELVSLKADLDRFRELIDVEVRRAQGLSRRGTEIEIPERFESMVIAKDREQEIYRSLIERLEMLDRLLEGYRSSRKLR